AGVVTVAVEAEGELLLLELAVEHVPPQLLHLEVLAARIGDLDDELRAGDEDRRVLLLNLRPEARNELARGRQAWAQKLLRDHRVSRERGCVLKWDVANLYAPF